MEKIREQLKKDNIPHLGTGNRPNKNKSNWLDGKGSRGCSETQADQSQQRQAVPKGPWG